MVALEGSPGGVAGASRPVRQESCKKMNLTIERAALLKALSHVQSVVERRTTIPILSNVLLRAETGGLSLSATDMDLQIVERVSARGEREGRTPAPAPTLSALLRRMPAGAPRRPEPLRGRNG